MKNTGNIQFTKSDIYRYNHIETLPVKQKVVKHVKTSEHYRTTRMIKIPIIVMIIGLFLSGITAFPLETELHWLTGTSDALPDFMAGWLLTVYKAIKDINHQYPFLSYGTDWLAFAHIMLAILFIGPYRNPVKNIWVIEFGMIACVLIFPLAFVMGAIRGIPFFWRLVDCSFGVIGIIPLFVSYWHIKKLELFGNRGA